MIVLEGTKFLFPILVLKVGYTGCDSFVLFVSHIYFLLVIRQTFLLLSRVSLWQTLVTFSALGVKMDPLGSSTSFTRSVVGSVFRHVSLTVFPRYLHFRRKVSSSKTAFIYFMTAEKQIFVFSINAFEEN